VNTNFRTVSDMPATTFEFQIYDDQNHWKQIKRRSETRDCSFRQISQKDSKHAPWALESTEMAKWNFGDGL